jgi:hypothetical protein
MSPVPRTGRRNIPAPQKRRVEVVLNGILKRVGGGISENSRSGPTFIDSLEVAGHPEIRNVRGTRYMIDHVGNAVGKNVSIGLLGKAVVVVKHDGGLYQDDSIPSLVISNAPLLIASVIVGIPLLMLSTIVGVAFLVGLYFFMRHRVRTVISAISTGA